jgi:hypothetical protein
MPPHLLQTKAHNQTKMKMSTMIITSLALACMATLVGCGGAASSPSASDPVVSDDNTTMSVDGTGAKLNHGTEMTTAFNGLALENVYIVDGDDKKITTSEVALNSKFSIVYEGVKNYTLKDGKAFPGLSIQVIDNNQVTVIQEGDLLAHYQDGLSEADASVLRATITVGDPMKPGKYICTVQVIDKNNNDSAIASTWEFDVK